MRNATCAIDKLTLALSLLISLLICTAALAAPDTDAMFNDAKQLAFAGNWDDALAKCAKILEICPACHDARVLEGRIHAWKKDYLAAREALDKVLEAKPGYADAVDALIDVNLWSGEAGKALALCNEALKARPGNAQILYKRALSLDKLGQVQAAKAAAREAVAADASNEGARKLLRQLDKESRKYSAAVIYSSDSYSDIFSQQHSLSVEITRKYPSGPITFRAATARKFGHDAVMFETETYPKLGKKTYAWLNAGFSNSQIFPASRLGIEIYTGLPGGFEASLGARRLNFSSDNPEIYTASLARYMANWSYTGRGYFSRKTNGNSNSGTLAVKRLYHGGDSHLGLTLGAGSTPSESIYALDNSRLDSRSASLEWKQPAGRSSSLTLSLGYGDEDFSAGGSIKRLSFSLSLRSDY